MSSSNGNVCYVAAASLRKHKLAWHLLAGGERIFRRLLWVIAFAVGSVGVMSIAVAPRPNVHSDGRLSEWFASLPAEIRERVVVVEPGGKEAPLKVFSEVRDTFGTGMATAFAALTWRRSAASSGGAEYGYALVGPMQRCVIVAPTEPYVGWGDEGENLRFVLDHELGHCLMADPAWKRTAVLTEERRADAFATLRRLDAGETGIVQRMHRMRMAMALADPDHATADRIKSAVAAWRPGMTMADMLTVAKRIASTPRGG